MNEIPHDDATQHGTDGTSGTEANTPGARWWVKKAARGAVTLGSLATGSLAMRALVGGPSVRALTYHSVGDVQTPTAFTVSRGDFDAQMRMLAEERRAVSLDDVRSFAAGRGLPTPGRAACLVTIDDGFVSMLTEILPTLERWNIPAVCFVTASLIGEVRDEATERYLTWDELRELAKSPLITIGSHADTHRSLGLMSDADARVEARRSKERLEDALGAPVRSFAYPFGTRADFSPYTERALADAGYDIAFNSMHGAIRPGMDPISLPRVKIEGGEPLSFFALQSRGAMDPWRAVDANLYRLQRVRAEIV